MKLISDLLKILQTKEEDVPYPEVSSSPWVSILFTIILMITLYFLSHGRSSPVDPIYMYTTSFILFAFIAINTTEWSSLRKVLGFDEPYPGYNILIGILGIGIGALFYAIATRPLAIIFAGNKAVMSLVKPLYIPYSIEPYMFAAIASTTFGIVLIYIVVGTFEELYRLLVFKNMSNFLASRGIRSHPNFLTAFMLSIIFFAGWHFFSWNGLTLMSIGMALVYGSIFWSSYFIPDIMGIISPETPLKWSGLLILGAMTSHTTWDVLVTMGILLVTGIQLIMISLALIIISILGMILIRYYYTRTFVLLPKGRS